MRFVIDFLFPTTCCFCKQIVIQFVDITGICKECYSHLPWNTTENMPKLIDLYGKVLLAFSIFNFEKLIAKKLRGFKFHREIESAQVLASLMHIGYLRLQQNNSNLCQSIFSIPFDLVIPIPLSESRQKNRGYNQVELIGRHLTSLLHIPMDTHSLIRSKETKKQTELKDYTARLSNMRHAFTIPDASNIVNKNILLLDDILTTGATLYEAALALYEVGAKHIVGFVIASKN